MDHILITPSASPPLDSHKRKKRRVSPLSKSSSSSSVQFDLHSARRDSSLRVLDAWSQLADRYSRRLDEDDIVDLRTVSLVKDRGVIRASPQKFKFGSLTANDTSSSDAGAPEDDTDELDALATEGVIPKELEKKIANKVPPLQPMDPADAEDLRQFLEAEKRRKGECGEDDDDDDDEEEDVHAENISISDASDEVADNRRVSLNDDPKTASQDSESEDELGRWDSDEGTKVYKVVHDDSESDSDIEIIESQTIPAMTSKVKPKKPPLQILDLAPPQWPPSSQLQTPPQSSSSVVENTPDIPFLNLRSAPPVKSRPLPKTVRTYGEGQPIPSSSTSSSVPMLNLAGLMNTGTKKSPQKAKGKFKLEVVVPRLASLRPKLQPSKKMPRTPSPPVPTHASDSEIEIIEEPPRFTAQEKGKGKAIVPPPQPEPERLPSSDSDDPLNLLPSSSPTEFEPGTPTTPRQQTSPSSSPLWTPSRMPRLTRTFSGKGRKRKRVWSSSEPSEAAVVKDPPPESSNAVFGHHEADGDDFGLTSSSSRISVDVETETPTRSKLATASRSGKTAKVRQTRRLRSQSGLHTETTAKPVTSTLTEITTSDTPFPNFYAPSDPYTPRQDRLSARRRHSARYSPPLSPPPALSVSTATGASTSAYNPFQDPRAQYIISQAMHQLSCIMTGAAPPLGTHVWPPPPLPPPPPPPTPSLHQDDGPPPFLQYQHGQWVPYTPRHHVRRGSHRRQRSLHASPSSPHTRTRSISPVHVYDPSFSGGTLPPSSPDPGPSSSPTSSPQQQRKSLVRRSKSRGRRVSFRLEDEDEGRRAEGAESDGEVEAGTRSHEPRRGHALRRTVSSPQIEALSVRGGHGAKRGKGRGRIRVEQEEEEEEVEASDAQAEEEEEDGGEEWSYDAAEPSQGRRFVRGQTPGPPSRGPSLRPVTPPRNPSRAPSYSADRRD